MYKFIYLHITFLIPCEYKMLEIIDESAFSLKIFDFSLDEKQWVNLGPKPICVLFVADWCNYCDEIQEEIKRLAEKYKETVDFYCVDCNNDKNPKLRKRLKIISVPVIIFVPLKGECQLLRGLFSENMIEFLIKDVLLK